FISNHFVHFWKITKLNIQVNTIFTIKHSVTTKHLLVKFSDKYGIFNKNFSVRKSDYFVIHFPIYKNYL
ncbi:MAG: hypothetical protein KGL95_16145, partial [Patescibacteria group bacterium]|nr:hypothetical protein [Patescibacteria group bacterium]